MQDRRSFLKKSAVAALAISAPQLPGCLCGSKRPGTALKAGKVEKALVAWYSQTGYTGRYGRLLAANLQLAGVRVTAGEMRELDRKDLAGQDLIVIGSPVYYYDAPAFVKEWLATLPDIGGVPVAAYVSFGGPEGNQHNAACSVLEGLADRGGAPVALEAFMNMGTYPLSWSGGTVKEHTWQSRYLPDQKTYDRVRAYAARVLERARAGQATEFSKNLTARELLTYLGPIWWTKQSIDKHYIIKDKCIGCGACARKCPVKAIGPDREAVDTEACVLCFGCLNNCPARAVYMEHDGDRLIGYLEFMEEHHLTVREPRELGG